MFFAAIHVFLISNASFRNNGGEIIFKHAVLINLNSRENTFLGLFSIVVASRSVGTPMWVFSCEFCKIF